MLNDLWRLSAGAMPSFRDPDGMVWVWDSESSSYSKKPDVQIADRGHATGGDNDLFDPFRDTEMEGVPELEGHMAASLTEGEHAPEGEVVCPNCRTVTDLPQCPQCGKGLGPEWTREEELGRGRGVSQFDAQPNSEASEFYSLPERVPKRNRMKTDDSYPSMLSKTTAADWGVGDFDIGRTETAKWIVDVTGQLHVDRTPGIYHTQMAKNLGLDWGTDMGALGSVYDDGTADVQRVWPGFRFDLAHTQASLSQVLGPVTVHPPAGAGEQKGGVFEPFSVTGGQWLFPQGASQVGGQAWVKERSEGVQYQRNMVLVAEHLQPEDFYLYQLGPACMVTATGGSTSHAAQLAVSEGWPAVVGVGSEAYSKIETGNYLKIDYAGVTTPPKTITVMPQPTAQNAPDVWNAVLRQRQDFENANPQYKPSPVMAASLDSCPGCSGPMAEKGGEKFCPDCGHRQPIIHATAKIASETLPMVDRLTGERFEGLLVTARNEYGDHVGFLVGTPYGDGFRMDHVQVDPEYRRRGIATRMVRAAEARGLVPNTVLDDQVYTPEGLALTGALYGHHQVSKTARAVEAGPAVALPAAEALLGGGEAAGIAGGAGGLGGISSLMSRAMLPFNAGRMMGMGGGSGPSPNASMPQAPVAPGAPMQGMYASTFGEEEVGRGTKNRGENSDPEEASSTAIEGTAEHGDSPEDLKDVGEGSGTKDASPYGDPGSWTDEQQGAVRAFEINLPLIQQYADDPENSGEDHPIVKAIDQMLEDAFPGYKELADDSSETSALEEFGDTLPDDMPRAARTAEYTQPTQPSAAGVPTCPICGQNHMPGTPCPTAPIQQPAAQPMVGMQPMVAPNTQPLVTTKTRTAEAIPIRDPNILSDLFQNTRLDEGGRMVPKADPGLGEMYRQMRLQGVEPEDAIAQIAQQTGSDPESVRAAVSGGVRLTGAWDDTSGRPLKEGSDYELRHPGYAVPDYVVIDKVLPDKVIFTISSGDVKYRDELTEKERHVQGYEFAPKAEGGDSRTDGLDSPVTAASWGNETPALPDPTPTGSDIDDWSIGDVIAAYPDGTIVLDDGITTYNMQRAQEFAAAHGWSRDPNAAPETTPGEEPVRPGQDAIPQIDDLSTPSTVVSNYDMSDMSDEAILYQLAHGAPGGTQRAAIEAEAQARGLLGSDLPARDPRHAPERWDRPSYRETLQGQAGNGLPMGQYWPPGDPRRTQGSSEEADEALLPKFAGDDPASRAHLLEGGSSEVDVDPALMAKLAGKDFSPREQREFIDEGGEARNLDKLDLTGTHYHVDLDDPELALW